MIYFTSDHHFGHDNIIKHCNRPFADAAEMDAAMIREWNAVVKPDDDVFHLGDLAHKRTPPGRVREIIEQLYGRKHLVAGNHELDSSKEFDTFAPWTDRLMIDPDWFDSVNPGYREIQVYGKLIVLSHYGLETWNGSFKGKTIHLHGHCVDQETEILTETGWKNPDTIFIGEGVYSYNPVLKQLEVDTVKEVIKTRHTGKVYELDSKSINLRVTNNHTVVSFSQYKSKFRELTADQTFSEHTVSMLRAGTLSRPCREIDPLLVKLYILMVADAGAPLTSGLVRYKVTKARKLDYCRAILEGLGIKYKSLQQGDGSVSLNFYVPDELLGLKVKGMDKGFMRSLSAKQFELVLDAYRYSDGCENGRGTIIYSSKEEEIDLLQEIAVISGYGATKGVRAGTGFSDKESYQLSVYPVLGATAVVDIKDRVIVHQAKDEPFWCIRNNNQNFLCRRKGKVHLTGNSHGKLGKKTRRFDVGVDGHPRGRPWSAIEIFEKMKTKTSAFLEAQEANKTHEQLSLL